MVGRLVKEGFFQKLFGPGIKAEEDRKAKLAFRVAMAVMYRADHVGSFLRPREMLDARSDPRITPEQLREIEDRHILRVLERQKDLGFRIFTDGELRRSGFMSDFYESVDGLDNDGSIARAWKGQARRAPAVRRPIASADGSRRRQDQAEEAAHQARSRLPDCATALATSR